MTNPKRVYNQTRLRNLKRAKLKFKESELQLATKNGADEKTINQIMKDISMLKTELNKK